MGAWSTRIFDDDGAADIRADYKILLGYGVPNEEVYRKIREKYYPEYKGKDDEDVYWLSIALYQWQNGVLMEEVKENAIRCIDDGRYLEVWKESGEKVYEKRKAVLGILREKLMNEVNPIKKVGKCPYYYRSKTKWKVGDLLAYRIVDKMSYLAGSLFANEIQKEKCRKMMEGKYVLLRVVENRQKPVTNLYPELDYMSWSNVMLYDWMGEKIPSEAEIRVIPFRRIVSTRLNNGVCRVVSAVSLERERGDKKYAEIIYLGNDTWFAEHKPELYLQNPRCPGQEIQRFNSSLLETFADIQDQKVIWEYRD